MWVRHVRIPTWGGLSYKGLKRLFPRGDFEPSLCTADFFNVFNRPINSDPEQITGLVNLGEQINEPRIIQLSLQLNW